MIGKPICPDLRCADPDHCLPASDEEQVLMVIEVGLVSAMLDGAIPQAEVNALVKAIRLLPGLKDLTEEQVNLLLARAGERTSRQDAWLCDVSRRLTNPGLRRVAFRMAALFCAWDGIIEEAEQDYLSWLAQAFEFDECAAATLFEEATGEAAPM